MVRNVPEQHCANWITWAAARGLDPYEDLQILYKMGVHNEADLKNLFGLPIAELFVDIDRASDGWLSWLWGLPRPTTLAKARIHKAINMKGIHDIHSRREVKDECRILCPLQTNDTRKRTQTDEL